MEIRCQIILVKHRFWKIHELETFGTRKRILRTKLEGCSCDKKRSVVFWKICSRFRKACCRKSVSHRVREKWAKVSHQLGFLSRKRENSFTTWCKCECIVPYSFPVLSNSQLPISLFSIYWSTFSITNRQSIFSTIGIDNFDHQFFFFRL